VAIPIYNGTIEADSTYRIVWSLPVNGTSSLPALLPGGTGFVVVYNDNSVFVLDPNNGQPVRQGVPTTAGPIVFTTGNFIALESAVVSYPAMTLTPLPQYRLLALAPNDTIVAFEIAVWISTIYCSSPPRVRKLPCLIVLRALPLSGVLVPLMAPLTLPQAWMLQGLFTYKVCQLNDFGLTFKFQGQPTLSLPSI
jgi:hypothetical protein